MMMMGEYAAEVVYFFRESFVLSPLQYINPMAEDDQYYNCVRSWIVNANFSKVRGPIPTPFTAH